jgi:hypothetical protein
MPCSRGAAHPHRITSLRLFASSAGYCQNPKCLKPLFVETGTAAVHIAEMAHIIAAIDGGPRTNPELSAEERGSFDNLILLCANCHTLIDKAPDDFPDPLIQGWKHAHHQRIDQAFGLMPYPDRAMARNVVEPLLLENLHVFQQLGPDNDYRYDPESDLASVWRRKMLSMILPNNRKILAIADANRRHLSADEQATVEAFRQHVDDLEAKHVAGGNDPASRFPADLHGLFA